MRTTVARKMPVGVGIALAVLCGAIALLIPIVGGWILIHPSLGGGQKHAAPTVEFVHSVDMFALLLAQVPFLFAMSCLLGAYMCPKDGKPISKKRFISLARQNLLFAILGSVFEILIVLYWLSEGHTSLLPLVLGSQAIGFGTLALYYYLRSLRSPAGAGKIAREE